MQIERDESRAASVQVWHWRFGFWLEHIQDFFIIILLIYFIIYLFIIIPLRRGSI